MHNSKLVHIIRTLNKPELNQLGDMILSPFFNKNESVSKLFSAIYKTYPKFKPELLDRQVLYSNVFGQKKFSEQKLRYMMSDLTKIAEKYLIYKELETKPILENHFLLTAFKSRNITRHSPSVLDQSNKLMKKYPFKDQLYYYEQYMIESDHYEYIASKRNVAVKENLNNIILSLDYYYVINKLKFSSELINHTNVYAGGYEHLLLDEILNYLKKNEPEDVPAIAIYHCILLTLTDTENEQHYFNLKSLLFENIKNFPLEELNDMFIFARNYCAKKINSGETQFLSEIFDLYKTLISNKIIFINNYLSQWDYKNIVSVGLRLGKFEWIHEFIYNYKLSILPDDRENSFTYNLAMYHYYLNEYERTLELLRDVEFTDVYYHLDCKSLLMKTYYELEEFDALHSLMDAFYVYLRRNKLISEYQRTSYSNLLKVVKKLIRIRYRDYKKVEDLENSLEGLSPIANMSWVKAKIKSLKKSN